MKFINDYFKLEQKGSNIRKEFIAGLTTFLAMAYILAVNPTILHDAGMEKVPVFFATIIAATVGTLIMGLLANYPVALAPGMGMNAFFTYVVCIGFGYSWQQALAGVFIAGIIFIILAVTGLREKIINAIPNNLKLAVGAGIGLFIAFIGLKDSNVLTYSMPRDANGNVVDIPHNVVPMLGDLADPAILVTIIGLIITIILYVKKVPASIFIGIIITAVINYFIGVVDDPTKVDLSNNYFGQFINGFTGGDGVIVNWNFQFFILIFAFLFLDFFDTAGTLVTVGRRAGLVSKEGKLMGSGKALLSDATATVIGAAAGTSNTTSYIESLAGIEAGGRTGLTSVFTAMFFVLSLLFLPFMRYVTFAVTAPALIMVGILMATQLKDIEWDDIAVAIPAFLTMIVMPLAYGISYGIALGFIFYPITFIATKRHKEIHPIMYVLMVVFIIYFAASSNTVLKLLGLS